MYAHTQPHRLEEDWEPLVEHLNLVAAGNSSFQGAGGFAATFGADEIARIAGLWHDLGKFAPEFQQYLRDSATSGRASRVDHSTAGALHATEHFKNRLGLVLAFVIAGHHAGLADYGSPTSSDESSLAFRLAHVERRPEIRKAIAAASASIKEQPLPSLPRWVTADPQASPLRIAMFVRMLFSCLIDADRLATESFTSPEQQRARHAPPVSMPTLRDALNEHIGKLMQSRSLDPSPVDETRVLLLDACRHASQRPPGLFSLTAPTGSGKTLSSMAFALEHAARHNLRRVIYALPFTSVTEQNAAVFREAFRSVGAHVVLEHHSAYRPSDADEEAPNEVWRRLAVENWDASVIVTTNVQLLESLFASRPSTCRKLHRLAQSVIVLDEAQSLPVDLLAPTLAALQELTHYGCSIVMSSATMPAITFRSDFQIGLKNVHEIVPDPVAMAASFRRAEVTPVGPLDDTLLTGRLAGHPRVLAIVNTRKHAARLFQLLHGKATDVIHLSALMCPAHRSDRVTQIKERLKGSGLCRVVSTQVVEAGVDIDFPVVYRSLAGLDSIVQAAGRCNREGRQARGQVVVFETEEPPPSGMRGAMDATRQLLTPDVDPLDLDLIENYFRLHYWQRGDPAPRWDGPVGGDGRRVGITAMLSPDKLQFRTAAEWYKIIDEWAVPIVVPYGAEGRRLCDDLLRAFMPDRNLLRAAQRFTVSISPRDHDRIVQSGHAAASPAGPTVLVQHALYDHELGLRVDGIPDPSDLFA